MRDINVNEWRTDSLNSNEAIVAGSVTSHVTSGYGTGVFITPSRGGDDNIDGAIPGVFITPPREGDDNIDGVVPGVFITPPRRGDDNIDAVAPGVFITPHRRGDDNIDVVAPGVFITPPRRGDDNINVVASGVFITPHGVGDEKKIRKTDQMAPEETNECTEPIVPQDGGKLGAKRKHPTYSVQAPIKKSDTDLGVTTATSPKRKLSP